MDSLMDGIAKHPANAEPVQPVVILNLDVSARWDGLVSNAMQTLMNVRHRGHAQGRIESVAMFQGPSTVSVKLDTKRSMEHV